MPTTYDIGLARYRISKLVLARNFYWRKYPKTFCERWMCVLWYVCWQIWQDISFYKVWLDYGHPVYCVKKTADGIGSRDRKCGAICGHPGSRMDRHPLVLSSGTTWLVISDIRGNTSTHVYANMVRIIAWIKLLWPLLLTWFNFNPSMDK